MNLPRRPTELFVVGSGRSGTTIVLSAIDCLDSMVAVPRLAGRLPYLGAVSARLSRSGRVHLPQALRAPSAECTALFREAGLTHTFQTELGHSVRLEDAVDLPISRLVTRLNSIRTNSGATTVVVKNTASCGRIPVLGAMFPRASFLHVLRHPADVVKSLLATDFWYDMTLWWDGRTTQQYARDETLTQEAVAARHWARQVSTAHLDLQTYAADRSTSVRYEDFLASPLHSLRVLDDVGLPFECSSKAFRRLTALGIRSPSVPKAIPPAIEAAVVEQCSGTASIVGISL